VIYTVKDPAADRAGLEDTLISFLEKSGLKKSLCRIGISTPVKGLENLGTAIQESLFANSSCLLDHSEGLRFRDSGLDQILLPAVNSPWTRKYYQNLLSKIMGYDAKHGAKLMETLMEYAENGGDMKLTAQKMFQHSNTIRYRIEKIRKLLDLGDDAGSFAQLYIFVRLHEIYGNRPDR
jgi:sugar diacid utilization regulator